MCRYRQPGMVAAPRDLRQEPAGGGCTAEATMNGHAEEMKKAATEVEEHVGALALRAVS